MKLLDKMAEAAVTGNDPLAQASIAFGIGAIAGALMLLVIFLA